MKFKITLIALFIGFISQAQVIANQPDDLAICDDNYDGFAIFDLTQTYDQIIGDQDPLEHYINFYLTQQDADININAIVNDIAYLNLSNPQTIYVRLEHVASSNFDTTSFDLIVLPKPIIGTGPYTIELCDDLINGSTGTDGISTFDLTVFYNEITLGDTSLTIQYYESLADQNSGNSILNPEMYQNILNPQTILVSVFNEFGCEVRTEITIVVLANPSPNLSPNPLEVCDDNNDGFSEFILTDADTNIINGEPNVTITYHDTGQNAEYGILPLSSPHANNVAFHDIVYFRAEFDFPSCFTTGILDLVVLDSPIISPITDYILPDIGNDGIEEFNLLSKVPEILNGQTDVTVYFFESLTDALTLTDPITVPEMYQSSGGQTIYVGMLDDSNACYSAIGEFELVLDPLAGINDSVLSNLSIYPNPTSEIIQIKSDYFSSETQVNLYNIQGQVVFSEIKNSETGNFTINVSDLTSGMYFVQIQSEGNTATKKLIKE